MVVVDTINLELHTFRSLDFRSVVNEAIAFLNSTPVHRLPPPESFLGPGVYSLYYIGDFPSYMGIAEENNFLREPIYVGKAVPPGWRTARIRNSSSKTLYGRLREHTRSIEDAHNLEVVDFRCRFMILQNIEVDLIVPVEAELIRKYSPLWNTFVDGFGNHDPGSGRYNQAKSEWDVLHPGRSWVDKLTGESPRMEDIIEKIKEHLNKS